MLIKHTDWVPYGDTQVRLDSYECDGDCTTCDNPEDCCYAKKCENCEEYYNYNRQDQECPYCGGDYYDE